MGYRRFYTVYRLRDLFSDRILAGPEKVRGPDGAAAGGSGTLKKDLTNSQASYNFPKLRIIMVPSSSGLGRRPLTPVTRVRTPLGPPKNYFKGLEAIFKPFFVGKKSNTPHYIAHSASSCKMELSAWVNCDLNCSAITTSKGECASSHPLITIFHSYMDSISEWYFIQKKEMKLSCIYFPVFPIY